VNHRNIASPLTREIGVVTREVREDLRDEYNSAQRGSRVQDRQESWGRGRIDRQGSGWGGLVDQSKGAGKK
jgi:hypothetical protein